MRDMQKRADDMAQEMDTLAHDIRSSDVGAVDDRKVRRLAELWQFFSGYMRIGEPLPTEWAKNR